MRQPKDPAVRAAIKGLESAPGYWTCDEIHNGIRQLQHLAFALEDAAPPDGWVLVPVEPTREMVLAAQRTDASNPIRVYKFMIAARPLPAPPARGEG